MLTKAISSSGAQRSVDLSPRGPISDVAQTADGPTAARTPIQKKVLRHARLAGHIAAAPAKMVVTPLVGLTVGTVIGLAWGTYTGGIAPITAGAILTDRKGPERQQTRNSSRAHFEHGVMVACYVTTMIVAVPVCAAGGAAIGAGIGAIKGTRFGIEEGYKASWNGSVPSLRRYAEQH